MWEKLLQQEVPVVGILVAAAALFLFRKAAISMKSVSSKPVVGSAMLLLGLASMGMSVKEMDISRIPVPQENKVALASYEGDSFEQGQQQEFCQKRYVPDQVAGGVLALSAGLIVCGI